MQNSIALKTLHWIMAAMIIAMLACGLIMTELADDSSIKWFLYEQHESIGIIIFGLLLLRVCVRLRHSFTPTVLPRSLLFHRIYYAVQLLLYGLMFLIPISGYLQRSPYGVHLFGIPIPVVREQFYLAGVGFYYHTLLTKILILIIGLHVFAYFKHRSTDNDAVFEK